MGKPPVGAGLCLPRGTRGTALGAASGAEAMPALGQQHCFGQHPAPLVFPWVLLGREVKPGVPHLVRQPKLSPRAVGGCEQVDGASSGAAGSAGDALHFLYLHLPPCQGRFLPSRSGPGMRNTPWWLMGDIPVHAASRHCPLLHWGFGAGGAGFSSTSWVLSGDISVNQKVSFPRSQDSGVLPRDEPWDCSLDQAGPPGLPRGTDSTSSLWLHFLPPLLSLAPGARLPFSPLVLGTWG